MYSGKNCSFSKTMKMLKLMPNFEYCLLAKDIYNPNFIRYVSKC